MSGQLGRGPHPPLHLAYLAASAVLEMAAFHCFESTAAIADQVEDAEAIVCFRQGAAMGLIGRATFMLRGAVEADALRNQKKKEESDGA